MDITTDANLIYILYSIWHVMCGMGYAKLTRDIPIVFCIIAWPLFMVFEGLSRDE